MNCQEIKEKYSDYIDCCLGECEGEVEKHLSECPDCKKDVGSLKLIVGKLGCLPEEDISPDFLVKLNDRLDELEQPWYEKVFSFLSPGFAGKAMASASMVALLALGVFYVAGDGTFDGGQPMVASVQQPAHKAAAEPIAPIFGGSHSSPITPVSIGGVEDFVEQPSPYSTTPRAPLPSIERANDMVSVARAHSAAANVPYVDRIVLIRTSQPDLVAEQVRAASGVASGQYLNYSSNILYVRTSLENADTFLASIEQLGNIEMTAGPRDKLRSTIIFQIVIVADK